MTMLWLSLCKQSIHVTLGIYGADDTALSGQVHEQAAVYHIQAVKHIGMYRFLHFPVQ